MEIYDLFQSRNKPVCTRYTSWTSVIHRGAQIKSGYLLGFKILGLRTGTKI